MSYEMTTRVKSSISMTVLLTCSIRYTKLCLQRRMETKRGLFLVRKRTFILKAKTRVLHSKLFIFRLFNLNKWAYLLKNSEYVGHGMYSQKKKSLNSLHLVLPLQAYQWLVFRKSRIIIYWCYSYLNNKYFSLVQIELKGISSWGKRFWYMRSAKARPTMQI